MFSCLILMELEIASTIIILAHSAFIPHGDYEKGPVV